MAADAKAAEEHGLLPPKLRRAFVFVMAATEASTRPVKAQRAIGSVDPVFVDASYMQSKAIICQRLREEGLYHLAWAVGVHEDPFSWFEPQWAGNSSHVTSMTRFQEEAKPSERPVKIPDQFKIRLTSIL